MPVTVSSGRAESEKMKKITGSLPLDSFEHHSLNEDLSLKTTAVLIEILSDGIKMGDIPDDDEYDWDTIHAARRILAQRLNYVLVEDLNKVLKIVLNNIIDEHNEFKKNFENHRHNKEENYSGKPVW